MSGLCLGCGRTLSEIKHWLVFTASERDEVMAKPLLRMAGSRGPSTDRLR